MVSQLTNLSFLSSSSSSPSSAGRRQNNNKMGGEKSCGGNGFPSSSSKKQPIHPSNNNNNDKSSIFLTPKVPFPLSVMGACGSGGGGGGGGSSSTSNNDDATPKYDATTTTTTKYETTTTTSSVPNSLEFKFEDAQLAKEMNDLSVKEREIRYEDLHGVSQLPEETIEFVNGLIHKLNVQLSKIPQSKRKWLDRAFFLKRCLETDTKFKLMFLRADRYDPYKAAVRMAAFFQSKVELFGEASIVKRITLDDINPRTVQLSGKWRHVSNYRDQAGRKVLALLPRFTPPDWKENIKFAWYQMYENIVDDEETQIKGIVYVVAASDCNVSPKNFIEYLCLGSQYLLTVPGRYNGFHFCHNHPAFKSVIAMLQYAIGKDHRSRTRVHYGSVLETQYALSTFGIDKRAMPIISNNTTGEGNDDNESGSCFDMEAHQQYLEQQRQRDANYLMEEKRRYKESGGQISYPNPQDVLVGRGRPFQEHIGNIRYLEVVDSNMIRYRNAKDRTEKSTLFRDVINYIHSNGGRFLQVSKDDGHYWIEAQDSTAREKVSHSFRHRPSPAVVPSKSSSTTPTSTSSKSSGLGGGESLLLSREGGNGIDGGVSRKSQPQQQQEEPDFFSKRKRGSCSSSNGVDPQQQQQQQHLLVPEQQISSMYHQQNKKNTTVFGSI